MAEAHRQQQTVESVEQPGQAVERAQRAEFAVEQHVGRIDRLQLEPVAPEDLAIARQRTGHVVLGEARQLGEGVGQEQQSVRRDGPSEVRDRALVGCEATLLGYGDKGIVTVTTCS